MLTRLWRVLVAVLALGTFVAISASPAAAITRTVSVGPLTVPTGRSVFVCAQVDGTGPCERVTTGPTTIQGTLTATVETPASVTPSVGRCGIAGVAVNVTGATGPGSVSAMFDGTVTPPQGEPRDVHVGTGTVTIPPSGTHTVTASVCVS